MPEYIYNGQWTPPCCLSKLKIITFIALTLVSTIALSLFSYLGHLKETMRYVFKIFNECGISYWLEVYHLLYLLRSSTIAI